MSGARQATSRKDARAAAAAKLREQEAARQKKERRIRIITVTAVLAVVLAGAIYAVMASRVTSNTRPQAVATQGGGIATGADAGAKVPQIDLWEDFQCPICAAFEKANGDWLEKQIEAKKVRVIFHPASFLSPQWGSSYSVRAANAAGVVADTGIQNFLDFHSILFANQPKEQTPGLTDQQLIDFAKQAGAKGSEVAQGIKDLKYKQWVTAVQQEFDKKGLQGTPTILINGKEVNFSDLTDGNQQFSNEKFQQLVEKAGAAK